MDEIATLVIRKKRGTKTHFMVMGGISLENAHSFVRWEGVKPNECIEYRGEHTFCSLVPPTNTKG